MTSALAGLSRTLAAQLPSAAPGSQVRIEGWVHRRRQLGAVTFLIVRDRSGLAQAVVRDPQARQVVGRCGEETVVAVTGVATPNPAAPGGVEVTEPRITLLSEPAQRSEFIAVEGFPMSKRPFYTHPQPGDERWSNSFDLLFRGQELVTGGQRLHQRSDYLAAIRTRGEDPAAYADYLEAFAHGMPPHGGFAIGLERWTGRLTEAENIREVTLFPRDLHRLTP